MGTFHDDKGELHGVTVVVDTHGPQVFVGRCDQVTDDGVVLLDADVHREGSDGRTKEEYLQRAARYGVWQKHARILVPKREVASVRRLGDLPV
ncbi:MAG: hypothetical protein ACE5JG_13020 [Planctomycetota bacterium]